MANRIEFRYKAHNIETLTRPLRQEVAALVEKTGDDIVSTAKSIVAVRTGFLRDSIEMQMERHGNASFGRIVAVIRVKASYGKFVELGTRKMAAQPFLVPAFEMHKQAFIEAMRQILG